MKESFRKLDKPLLIITLFLSASGIVMIFSASSISSVLQYKVSQYYFFSRQLEVIIVGLLISLFIYRFPLKNYKYLSVLFLAIMLIIMAVLKTHGIVTNSARSWISIAGFRFQPSEFAKTALILFLSSTYGYRKKYDKFFDTFIPIIPCLLVFGLVVTEPDLGTGLIIAFICAAIFFSLPFNKDKSMFLLKAFACLGVAGIILIMSNPNKVPFLTKMQKARITYQKPCDRYLEDTGYQVCNGYIAINNGGLFGAGLGKSTQKYLYLPEAHTDFIFPIIVEELGVARGYVLLLIYIILLFRILIIARNAKSLSGSIIAFGTFMYIFSHILVNLGGVLALIPLTGVPLPFMSYGGSFMLNLLILIALTQRVAIESKSKKEGN